MSTGTFDPKSPWIRLAFWLAVSPILALVGAVVVLIALDRWLRRARDLPTIFSATLPCPNGHANDVSARWECASCKATYQGWVGRCGICGAGAGWFPCETCGVAIVLPWRKA